MKSSVAIYVRVSTANQNTSLQKSEILEYCKFRKWDNYTIYEDVGSGIKADRQQRELLLRNARRGRHKMIVIYRLDRFSRNIKDLVLTLSELDSLGVKFISLHEEISTDTPAGKLMTNLLIALSSFERDLLISRVKSGLEEARRKGKTLGRPRTLPRDEIKRLSNKGLSIRSIAKELNISKSSVQVVLSRKSKKPSCIE